MHCIRMPLSVWVKPCPARPSQLPRSPLWASVELLLSVEEVEDADVVAGVEEEAHLLEAKVLCPVTSATDAGRRVTGRGIAQLQ